MEKKNFTKKPNSELVHFFNKKVRNNQSVAHGLGSAQRTGRLFPTDWLLLTDKKV